MIAMRVSYVRCGRQTRCYANTSFVRVDNEWSCIIECCGYFRINLLVVGILCMCVSARRKFIMLKWRLSCRYLCCSSGNAFAMASTKTNFKMKLFSLAFCPKSRRRSLRLGCIRFQVLQTLSKKPLMNARRHGNVRCSTSVDCCRCCCCCISFWSNEQTRIPW